MSASVLSFNQDDAFAAGCDDFLPKPFREANLLAPLSLARRLDWQPATETMPTLTGSRSPFNGTATHLAPAHLAELLAIARRGEIVAFRRRLAELRQTAGPADALLEGLDTLAISYRMERIRELLERAQPVLPS